MKKNKKYLNTSLFFLFLIALFIIFHKPLEDVYNKTVVRYFLIYVEGNQVNDALFSIGALLVIVLFFSKVNNYTVPINPSIFLFLIGWLYYYYRFIHPIKHLTPFSFYEYKIKYADIILLATVCNSILLIKSLIRNRLPQNNAESFSDDEPLGENKNDNLNYTKYAQTIAKKISISHFDKAFAIGINGRWGTGKTSFIDLIKRSIKNQNIIEVDFNPWNSHTPEAIIQDFFETFQEAIRPYNSSLSRLLISYSKKLVEINENKITRGIQSSISIITGLDPLNTLLNDVNDSLRRINKKIVVFIDDLDRLDKEEIVEAIRLIRNTANFFNTFFIVAYDRNYIISSLKDQNVYKPEHFLEKIFQLEVTLPYFDKKILKNILIEKIKKITPESIHKTLEEGIKGTAIITPLYLEDWLENMRDVTRLTNTLNVNLKNLIGEIDLVDFIKLELLRLKYPSVYNLLHEKTENFLHAKKEGDDFLYQLRKIKDTNVRTEEETKEPETFLEQYLINCYTNLSVPKNEIKKIIDHVEGIFGKGWGFHHRSHLSITHPSKFNRYFSYNLLMGDLSEIEFSKAREKSQKEFNVQISKWIEEGLESNLLSRFEEIEDFDNKEDFEKIITAIFHLANCKSKREKRNLVMYEDKNLLNKLDDYDNKLSTKIYNDLNGKKLLHDFVMSFFINSKSPFTFESNFANHLNQQYSDSFPLTKEELSSISLDYFKRYCDENSQLDNSVWQLFHDCKTTNWVDLSGGRVQKENVIPDEAKITFKTFISGKALNEYLLEIISIDHFKEQKYGLRLPDIFTGWDDFEQFINAQEEWVYLPEFREFFNACKLKNFKEYIPFDFKTIPVLSKKR